MTLRSKVAMLVAEFLGTAVLATSVINISRSQIGIGYFVAIGVGLTLGLLVLALGSASGAHFNPAITLGQWTIRKIGTLQAIAYIAAQFLGAVVAWRLSEYLTGQTLRNIANKNFEWKVLVAEAVGTFVFTFLIAAAIYQGYRGLRLAATVGGGLFLGIIVATAANSTGITASNGILNPALALGTQSWSKAYVFGPLIGGVLGMNVYALLFAPESLWTRPAAFKRSRTVVTAPKSSDSRESTSRSAGTRTTARKTAKKPASRRRSTR